MEFYKKNDAGNFVSANEDVDELFRQKSDSIIRAKFEKAREREIAKLREEIEPTIRKETEASIKSELQKELSKEWESKINASEKKASELEVKLRRKTIAAEYGFSAETEEFLGSGNEDEMRAKADLLKTNFQTNAQPNLEKQTSPSAGDSGCVTLVNH